MIGALQVERPPLGGASGHESTPDVEGQSMDLGQSIPER